jgi:hypothetical protein
MTVVFETTDRLTTGLAEGLLEAAGIPYWIDDDETAARLVLGPIVFPTSRLLVPDDLAEGARSVLASLTSPSGESR